MSLAAAELVRCSACDLFVVDDDLAEDGRCRGCVAAKVTSPPRLCSECELPTSSPRSPYCDVHALEALDRRVSSRYRGRMTPEQLARARVRERRRRRAPRPLMDLMHGSEHQRLRRALKPYVDAGSYDCARCGEKIKVGQPWDLGHIDGSTEYAGPEHARAADCPLGGNRATARKDRRRV